MRKRRKKVPDRKQAIPVTPEMAQILERRRQQFREKFGRAPGPTDPIFFDPNASEPRPLDPERVEQAVLHAMEQAGIDPAKIHAYRRTGLLVSRANVRHLPKEDLAEWQAALDEYAALQVRRN